MIEKEVVVATKHGPMPTCRPRSKVAAMTVQCDRILL
jgi:hypothetical protein